MIVDIQLMGGEEREGRGLGRVGVVIVTCESM